MPQQTKWSPATSVTRASSASARARCFTGRTMVSSVVTSTPAGRSIERAKPASVVVPQRPAGLGERRRVAAVGLGRQPREPRRQVGPPPFEPVEGPPRHPLPEARPEEALQHRQHPPLEALGARVELQRGRHQDQPGDQLGVAMGGQQAERPAHRVAEHHHVVEPEVADQRRGVVGGVLEGEGQLRPQAAPVAAHVHGDERVPRPERLVGGEPLQVGAGRPPVEEHQRRCAGLAAGVVAVEDLASAGHVADERRGQPGRRHGLAEPPSEAEPSSHALDPTGG